MGWMQARHLRLLTNGKCWKNRRVWTLRCFESLFVIGPARSPREIQQSLQSQFRFLNGSRRPSQSHVFSLTVARSLITFSIHSTATSGKLNRRHYWCPALPREFQRPRFHSHRAFLNACRILSRGLERLLLFYGNANCSAAFLDFRIAENSGSVAWI